MGAIVGTDVGAEDAHTVTSVLSLTNVPPVAVKQIG